MAAAKKAQKRIRELEEEVESLKKMMAFGDKQAALAWKRAEDAEAAAERANREAFAQAAINDGLRATIMDIYEKWPDLWDPDGESSHSDESL